MENWFGMSKSNNKPDAKLRLLRICKTNIVSILAYGILSPNVEMMSCRGKKVLQKSYHT